MRKILYLFIIIIVSQCLPVNAQKSEQDRGRAYYDIGIFAFEDEDYNEAESNFLRALSFNPDNPDYNHYLGKTYMKIKRFGDARKYLIKAMQINPEKYLLKYDLAMLNYEQGDYLKASELFTETAQKNTADINACFYAGMSLFKLERYSQAIDFFNTAANNNPDIKPHAFYYSGVSCLKMGNNKKAVEYFEYVKTNAKSEYLQDYAQKWLNSIESGKKTGKSFSIYVKSGWQYDDNAVLESPEGDTPEGKEDFISKVFASLNVDAVNQKNYKLGGGYSHYQTWHKEHNDLDIVASIFNINAKYKLHPFTLGLSYIPCFYAVDSSTFLVRHQISPELVFSTDNFISSLSYSFYTNDYADDDSDGHTDEINLDAYYNIGNTGISLFAGLGYEDNSASLEDKYYTQLTTKLGASFHMPWEISLSLTGKYYKKDYDRIEREDDKYTANLSISRRLFFKWLTVNAEYDYTKNNSTGIDYEYERNAAALSLISIY